MKKRNLVKIGAIVTAVSLAVCGCGSAESAGNAGQFESQTQTAAGETTENSNGEMTTFTFSKISYPSVTLAEGQTPDDNAVLDYLRDNYQVDMKLAWQAEVSEYNNKLSLNIASGSLPDIFYLKGDDYRTFVQLAQNGMLADLTDIYEDNISDTIKNIDASYGGRNFEPVTVDGRIMAVPAGNLDGSQDVLWLR